MKIHLHLPRKSEATLEPELEGDITISPRFFKRAGWVPFLHVTTTDSRGRNEHYELLISAATKEVRIRHLVEVIPECEDEKVNANNKASEDKDVCRAAGSQAST